MNIEGGVQSAGGERSANFARRALAEKGGYFAAAACQLAAFSSKFFQTGRSAFLLKIDLGALSRVGEFNVV